MAKASEMRWAAWQAPPVKCAACGKRVRLADPFFASWRLGTFHAPGCLPYEHSR